MLAPAKSTGEFMRLKIAAVLGALMTISAARAPACSRSEDGTAFDAVAPTATDIIVVQVEALALEAEPALLERHKVRGKVRVLKHYRGSGAFTELEYVNTQCSGLRIDVGGIYLIATNSAAPSIELNALSAPILQLTGAFPVDPELVLRTNHTILRLLAALRGKDSFQVTTDQARQGLSRYDPPPRVPHPDEFTDE